MTAKEAIAIILQLLALFPTVAPAVVQAVKDFQKLFEDGHEPTQSDIDELMAKMEEQSKLIQNL